MGGLSYVQAQNVHKCLKRVAVENPTFNCNCLVSAYVRNRFLNLPTNSNIHHTAVRIVGRTLLSITILSVCHTSDPCQNGSKYRNAVCTVRCPNV